MNIALGNLSKPDGSAMIELNNTIVLAAVFGPVEVSQTKINYEEAYVEVQFKPKVSIPSTSPEFDYVRENEQIFKSILKEIIMVRQHPRTMISIIIQEVFNAGSLITVAVNAACCALLDSGIQMKSLAAAVSILCKPLNPNPNPNVNPDQTHLQQDYEFVINPDLKTEEKFKCKFMIVYDRKHNMISMHTKGTFSRDILCHCIQLGREQVEHIFDTYRSKIAQSYQLKDGTYPQSV